MVQTNIYYIVVPNSSRASTSYSQVQILSIWLRTTW